MNKCFKKKYYNNLILKFQICPEYYCPLCIKGRIHKDICKGLGCEQDVEFKLCNRHREELHKKRKTNNSSPTNSKKQKTM